MSFPVVAGVAETFRASFWMGATAGMSVLGATFQAACYVAHGEERGELVAVLPVEHDGSRENAVLVTVPELEHGHYHWELRATDPEGRESRLLYGTLSALNAADAEYVVRLAEESELRELSVQMAEGHSGPLMLRWQSCAAAASLAADAARYAKEAREAVARLEGVEAAVQEFRVFVSGWQDNMQMFLVMNPVTGTIWVNGFDTGQPYQGEPGKAPRVNAYGFWETYQDGQWVTLPYQAAGKDGLDGDKVRRVLLGSRDELPTEEERGVFYYTPKASGSGYDMWCWLENAGWVCFGGDPYGLATTTSLGLVQLGTDAEVQGGAPVGLNGLKRMAVPAATSSVPGVVKPSGDAVSDTGGGTHMSVSGSLLTDVATVGRFGAVKISTSTVLTEGAVIGVNAAGQMLVPVATTSTNGVFRLGTNYPINPGDGYRVGVGAYNGQLCIAFVPKGALRHWRHWEWTASGMDWVSGVSWPSTDSYYTCLLTSGQFDQDEKSGLMLRAATAARLAGVHIAEGADDVRGTAVLTAAQVKALYAGRDAVYSKEEMEDLFVRKDWHGDVREVYLTLSEYQALKVRDPKVAYNILED